MVCAPRAVVLEGVRRPTWSPELSQPVLELRGQYPCWGKDKLVVLLTRQGWQVSTSMVGRILTRLKAREISAHIPRSSTSCMTANWRWSP